MQVAEKENSMRRRDTTLMPASHGEETRRAYSAASVGYHASAHVEFSRGRLETPSPNGVADPEESVVVDERNELTPAQAVENKLMALLKEAALPVSHLQMRGLLRSRGSQ
jgi:hypothetical protein